MQNKNFRKNVTKGAAIACAAVMAVGSLAYFSDRVEVQATGKSGNVQIETTAFAGASAANVLVDRDGQDNLNPGDVRDLTFTVSNEGNKAVDLRHTIKLTVKDGAGAALNLTEIDGQAEFDIYAKGDVTYTPAAGYVITPGKKPIFSTSTYADATGMGVKRTVTDNTITYYFADTTLLGKNGVANAERVENSTLTASTDVAGQIDVDDNKDSVTYEYVLVYRNTTLNKFMNSGIQVDMVVEAKQHYNTNSDWTTVATQSFTAGNLTQASTPDHGEDTVGGTSVAGNNNITDHVAVTGSATENPID